MIDDAEEYLGLRSAQVEVENDSLDEARKRVAELDRAIKNVLVASARNGLSSRDIEAAVSELTAQRDAARRHVSMIEAWQEESAQESQRMRELWALAEHARTRLPAMTPEEQKQVLELLDVRVTILDSGSRSAPARVRVEGTVFEHALLQGIAPEKEGVDGYGMSRFRPKGHLEARAGRC